MSDFRVVLGIRQDDAQGPALQPFLPGRVIGHLGEVKDPHRLLLVVRYARLYVAAVDKRREALDEFLRLFPMREMSGGLDHIDSGAGNFLVPPLAIGGSDDAVLRSPQQQRRYVDAV